MANVNDFLAALNNLSEKNSVEVFLPAVQRTVKFKPFSAKQQKSFYNCIKDNILFNTKFTLTSYTIIKDNCLEQEVVDKLTIIDRVIILLALRRASLGSKLNVTGYDITLDDCLQQVTNITVPANKTVTIENIQIEISVPLATEQYLMEKQLRENLQSESRTIHEAAGDLILNGICLYIKKLWINGVALNYEELLYKDRLTVIESLPANTLLEIQEYASIVTNTINSILEVEVEPNTKVAVAITSDLFLN